MSDMDHWLVSFAIQGASAKETWLLWFGKCHFERKTELISVSGGSGKGGFFTLPFYWSLNECEQVVGLSRMIKGLVGLGLCEFLANPWFV